LIKTLNLINKDLSLLEINTKDIGSGIYFLHLNAEKTTLLKQKCIIQHND